MIYFIAGILFAIIAIPIIESLVEWVQLAIEKKKGKLALEIAKMNKDAADMATSKEQTYVVGFQAPPDEEELSEEDEDF